MMTAPVRGFVMPAFIVTLTAAALLFAQTGES